MVLRHDREHAVGEQWCKKTGADAPSKMGSFKASSRAGQSREEVNGVSLFLF